MKLSIYILITLVALAFSAISQANPIIQPQISTAGKLAGLVVDPGKARVPAAKVIVEGKNFRREVASADDGSYAIELPEGKYMVEVIHDGFYPSPKKTVLITPNGYNQT